MDSMNPMQQYANDLQQAKAACEASLSSFYAGMSGRRPQYLVLSRRAWLLLLSEHQAHQGLHFKSPKTFQDSRLLYTMRTRQQIWALATDDCSMLRSLELQLPEDFA